MARKTTDFSTFSKTPIQRPGPANSPLKIIRLKCLDCCCESSLEVKLCPASDCPNWYWRFGKKPKPNDPDKFLNPEWVHAENKRRADAGL